MKKSLALLTIFLASFELLWAFGSGCGEEGHPCKTDTDPMGWEAQKIIAQVEHATDMLKKTTVMVSDLGGIKSASDAIKNQVQGTLDTTKNAIQGFYEASEQAGQRNAASVFRRILGPRSPLQYQRRRIHYQRNAR